MKYASRDELVSDIDGEYAELRVLLAAVPREMRDEPGVWGDGWTVTDLVAHLTEWHRLFLGWYRAGLAATTPEMPAPGYKWNETPKLNRALWRRNRGRSYDAVRADFERSHAEVRDLVRSLEPEDLLTPGRFAWTGRNTLTTYVGANTASHYRFAIKVLKRWRRRQT